VRKVILASASPRRSELLKLVIPEFEVVPSDFDEDSMRPGETPEQHVLQAALEKAREVARKRRCALVIGADTVVVVDVDVLGKPRDEDDARRMLHMLSGRGHFVYTGLAVVTRDDEECCATGCERTEVRFRPLPHDLIDRYIATGEPMDKAGAYAIQGRGCVLVESIEGCYFNVVGLPLYRLSRLLEEFGVEVLVPG